MNGGNDCTAVTTTTVTGTTFRIGIEQRTAHAFLQIEDTRWGTITPKASYNHTVQIGTYPAVNLVGVGGYDGAGRPGMAFWDLTPAFWGELANGSGITIWYNGSLVLSTALNGGWAAMAAVLECQGITPSYSAPYSGSNPYARPNS
jgi:hypothetical protein